MKLRYLMIASLVVVGCASQQDVDTQSANKDVQQTSAVAAIPQDKGAALPQDMGSITQSEIQQRESLSALQMEAVGNVRSPAVESDDEDNNTTAAENNDAAEEAPVANNPSSEDLFNAEKYTVQQGDTLSKIAYAHYGKVDEWKKIAALNSSLVDPNKIEIGQIVYLPKENMQAGRAVASTTDDSEEKGDLTPLANNDAKPSAASKQNPKNQKAPTKDMNRSPAKANYDDEATAATATTPEAPTLVPMQVPKSEGFMTKNISRIIGFIGFTLFLAVFVSFALSKPKKTEDKTQL